MILGKVERELDYSAEEFLSFKHTNADLNSEHDEYHRCIVWRINDKNDRSLGRLR